MKKSEMILGIIELYDELEAEKVKNRQTSYVSPVSECEGISEIDRCLIAVGKNKVLEEAINKWWTVNVHKDDETGRYEAQSYEDWLRRKVEDVPGFMSRNQFYEYFADDLRDIYDHEVDEETTKLIGVNIAD